MTEREIVRLAEELCLADNPGLPCFRPLIQLLSTGEPVSVEQLADATSGTSEEFVRMLQQAPSIEFDAQGNIVGAGLTLRPTPHRFEVDGRTLYTWCALDALMFPALLGRTVHVSSPTPGIGTPVRVTVTPEGVASTDPPTAVVSIVKTMTNPDIRQAFCNYVHFFSATDTAEAWLDQHPGALLLSVPEAF
ncbi:MAG TPA: organomercurial lyase MerB, partial [Acidimicrobiales bacterium]|nr:organomercurial lyase MerB [Acidimicrobiales bacterium]